jgi:erythrocyte band 7 integral membrane protein
MVNIDLRTVTFDVPPQEILTKDSVTVTVDAVVYFRVFDPVISVKNVENVQYSTRLLAATTLRNILGKSGITFFLTLISERAIRTDKNFLFLFESLMLRI